MSKADPGIVVKRTEQEFLDWLSTEDGFASGLMTYNDEPLILETYQRAFMANQASYRSVEKSRQTGFSFVFAIEALARTHLRPVHNSIFVSYNLSDAKEKIAYAQQMHDELPLAYQKQRIVDSKLELAFRSNSAGGKISRIISNPSKAPRGKKGDIYLDELAHCANDREIYKGSTALILRSRGQLSVCSSPLGRRGQFWEIARQEVRPYRAFSRQYVPWWLCSMFCRDVVTASREAPKLSTEQRVEAFGTDDMISQFESLPLEDFQQEFEVRYVDETLSFYPYSLILPVTDPELELATDFAQIKLRSGERLVGGFDVGRTRDLSVLALFAESKNGVMRCLMIRRWSKVPFDSQEKDLRYVLNTLPIARLSIDKTGLGMQLAENLARDFPQVVQEQFTAATKELWCTDFKIRMQSREVWLPRDQALIREIHSIKKNVTAAGRVTFESTAPKSKGHADTFWAIVLATKKERGEVRKPGSLAAHIIGAEADNENRARIVAGNETDARPGIVLLLIEPSNVARAEVEIALLKGGGRFRRNGGRLARSGSYIVADVEDPERIARIALTRGIAQSAEIAR